MDSQINASKASEDFGYNQYISIARKIDMAVIVYDFAYKPLENLVQHIFPPLKDHMNHSSKEDYNALAEQVGKLCRDISKCPKAINDSKIAKMERYAAKLVCKMLQIRTSILLAIEEKREKPNKGPAKITSASSLESDTLKTQKSNSVQPPMSIEDALKQCQEQYTKLQKFFLSVAKKGTLDDKVAHPLKNEYNLLRKGLNIIYDQVEDPKEMQLPLIGQMKKYTRETMQKMCDIKLAIESNEEQIDGQPLEDALKTCREKYEYCKESWDLKEEGEKLVKNYQSKIKECLSLVHRTFLEVLQSEEELSTLIKTANEELDQQINELNKLQTLEKDINSYNERSQEKNALMPYVQAGKHKEIIEKLNKLKEELLACKTKKELLNACTSSELGEV